MYFNEHEPYAAAWLRNLWPAAHIDERSVADVQSADLAGYQRVHLFAGIGGWEYALQLAGWPEEEEVWTGSCPCQPFSSAGRHAGVLDERHLWPAFHRLIAERRPTVVFGEQVASAAGRAWLAGVCTDLEDLGYAVGAADLCAASLGAPHIRQRLYWVAESTESGRGVQPRRDDRADGGPAPEPRGLRDALGLADTGRECDERRRGDRDVSGSAEDPEGKARERERRGDATSDRRSVGGMGESDRPGRQPGRQGSAAVGYGGAAEPTGRAGFWDAYDLLLCRDGKARRVEPGSFPLAHGIPARVGRLRAYGNAIVGPLAAEFIKAYRECRGGE